MFIFHTYIIIPSATKGEVAAAAAAARADSFHSAPGLRRGKGGEGQGAICGLPLGGAAECGSVGPQARRSRVVGQRSAAQAPRLRLVHARVMASPARLFCFYLAHDPQGLRRYDLSVPLHSPTSISSSVAPRFLFAFPCDHSPFLL